MGIMQSLPIFIVELQTAKRELLKNFELPDDSRPHQNATQRRRVVKNGRSLTPSPGGDIRFNVMLHG
jgi:hypothetical protein